jgi:Uma2 family endonuclease
MPGGRVTWLVASSSPAMDTRVKPELYAAAGVPDHWVVDVAAPRVQVLREPGGDGYGSQAVHKPDGLVQPVAVDLPPLDLAALFRRL